MVSEAIKPKEITKYTKPLIWIAAMWDRGKNGPTLIDYLEHQLESFLANENEKKVRMIHERETLIARRKIAVNTRKRVDPDRDEADKAYMDQLEKEINQLESIYAARAESARRIIDTKKVCYMRYRGGAK